MVEFIIAYVFTIIACIGGSAYATYYILKKHPSNNIEEFVKRLETLEEKKTVHPTELKAIETRMEAQEKASLSQGNKVYEMNKKLQSLENLVKRGGAA